MSLRGTKRATMRGEEPGTSKRRRAEPEDALWQLRPVSDLKMSSIYNRSASEAPAELFRKDLISAMKLPDSEPLALSEYWIITDTWKQDWERGVQVPVNPDSLPAPKVKEIENPMPPNFVEFKLPKDKYIHLTRDSHYQPDKHQLSTTPARAEAACSYDLDAIDTSWLKLLNAERARAGALPINEDQFERVIEELEVRTWDKIQSIMKSEEGLGIEYDENVICDVCRSPDSEDGNEMVFCDSCNICVHQACYGITVIPDGQWLCRPCGDGVRPTCVLCPNQGGAMKCTPSGHKWAHVSCVLWIPEVSIGCAEKMEPITKISSIPASRWSLVCVLCRERKGACIQCSVKTCKTAYHVTCAFKHGLEMRAIIEDENADDGVKLRSYCQKHSVNNKKEKAPTAAGSGSEEEEVKRKRRKDMTSEEKTQARAARLQEIEREFYKHVSVKEISSHILDVDHDGIVYIHNYWQIKRRAGHNRPLLPPKSDDNELLTHRQEQADLDKMKMFVQLRQDLERVRNLCYMVSRREKLSRSFFRMREQTFHKQLAVLTADPSIKDPELSAIIEANHGPSIYDRLYSHPNAPDHKHDFDALLARIAPPDSEDEKEGKKKKDRNGLVRRGSRSSNPYKKHYVNGSRRSRSIYSGLSSEESAPEISRTTRYRGRACIGSSTDDEGKKKSSPKKKKILDTKLKGKRGAPKKIDRKKKTPPKSKALIDSSTEGEDFKTDIRKDKSKSKTLQQMEKEMKAGKSGLSGTDSDDLMPMKISRNNKFPVDIYSDSSEEMSSTKHDIKSVKSKVKEEKEKFEMENPEHSPNGNDSQQSLPRTKAAMKEFIPSQSEKKSSPLEDKPAPKKRGRKPSNKGKKITLKSHDSEDEAKDKENIKFSKQKDNPTDLIVPQRQAAKKASENMRSTTKKEETVPDKPGSGDETKPKMKLKSKSKEKPATVSKKPSKDAEKETIAYVPQRQAAKKAAAHIKSGLGTKLPAVETPEIDKKKETEKTEYKVSPRKEDVKSKTPQKSSPSDSNHSNDSSACSSEEEEQGKRLMRPTAKAREIKPVTRQLFSPPGSRPTVDLPFLDKVSRPLSSTSASSDSESSKGSKYSSSSTPIPKRPRRRRKGKSVSTDSPRKAPDKKLKTSERGSECRVSSESIEGEKLRTDETRAATRSRTRSITASGNMLDKPGSRQRKPSKEDTNGPNKTPKEDSQSCKLSSPERKADEEVNKVQDEPPEQLNTDVKVIKNRRPSVMIEDKKLDLDVPSPTKSSPKKASLFKEIRNQNKRVKETKEVSSKEIEHFPEKIHSPPRKIRRPSILEPQPEKSNCTDMISPTPDKKPTLVEKPVNDLDMKKPLHINDDIIIDPEKDKHWFPKPPRPHVHPPPVEKPGDHEKYITEDKVLDLDSADKSSLKMIATIQANLNENTMIKSPKTPMDARTINMDNIELENPIIRNKRKCSNLDPENKFIAHDSSHVQGVEISKSAKIPSAMSQFPNRSMLSPQHKDNEFFELDMLPVDDGFNHDDMMKPFASYPEFFFKEDSKEQGVQETLNLVDRLRMQLTKKVPTDNTIQDGAVAISEDLESKDEDKISVKSDLEMSSNEQIKDSANNHSRPDLRSESLQDDNKETTSILEPNDHISIPDDSQSQLDERKYTQGHEDIYNEEAKDSSCVHLDNKSNSTTADTISISKQSDDSQSISVVDHSVASNDPDLTQDNQHYENNNSVMNSDCATIPSPPFCRESKWRESKITTRRSSASSTNSDGSVCSRKTDTKSHMNSCDSHQGNVMPDIDTYPPIPAYSCPVEPSMPLNQYSTYPPDASPFLTTMGTLFAAGACASSQLPLPSPGPALYGPNLAFPTPPLLPSLPKQAFPTLCAAFTSSSQNIALTTAMIAPPTPKTLDSPRDDTIDVTESDKYSIHVASESSPSISVGSFNEASNTRTMVSSKLSLDSNDTSMAPVSEDKSPSQVKVSKLTKFPGKSPGKSPGISPKQSDAPKSSKRPSNKSNRSQRGRGRSKSRSHAVHNFDYMGNSIQSKLVGTVYDFNEEIANDGVDLKALRDRRKSVDIRDDRKSEISYKDSSRSPGVASPQSSKRIPQMDLKEAKPPSTHESQDASASPSSKTSERGNFSQVQPVLPGPVDMRTYNPFDNPPPTTGDAYHSHLLAFASGTAEQQLMEIDEEVEKQLHSALMASKPKTGSPTVQAVGQAQNNQMGKETLPPQLPKVSLSDSRNQLKVKIKGPFLDANYSTSSTQPPVIQPPAPTHDTNPNILSSNSGVATSMTGSTNLRRMRKKELLRQYWTQDMNMDDPTNNSTIGVVPPPVPPQPLARAVITIPKAVASMTSIPTREDYKNSDAPVEKKKRKISTGPSRELRQLKVSMNDDIVDLTEANNAGTPHKRRSRVCTTKPNRSNATSPLAPKLKIKIKSNVVQQVCEEFSQFRPPKKRLSSIPKPSLEDLRRESMKYRKMVMADFEKEKYEKKKYKSNKSEGKSDASKGEVRKKKDRKTEKDKTKLSESAPKLIIKIKRDGVKSAGPSNAVATAAAVVAEPAVDPFEYDPTAPDPLALDPPSYAEASSAIRKRIRTAKVTPIRLKLSRSSQGSGYVMKNEGEAKADNDDETTGQASADPSLSDPASTDNIVTSPNLAEKKSEVR